MRCSAVYPWTLNVATRGVLTHLENTKNHFRPGLCPGPRWGSSQRSPDPVVGWGGDTPSPFLTPSTPSASRFSAHGASQLNASGVSARRLDPVCPSTSLECPLNGFSWRRACRRGLAMRILSVRPSICLSVKCVLCDKTVERSVQIYIPHERTCRAQ